MPDGTPTQTSPTPKNPVPAPRQSRAWLWPLLGGLLILGLIATVVPLTGNRTDLHTWTQILLFCVLAQSWNYIGGFTGYAAFGNVAFFGIGAYTVGIFVNNNHPLWEGLVVGALLAGGFALLLGLPVLRLRGHYFAIATLGTAEALRELAAQRNVGAPGGEMFLPLSVMSKTGFFYAFLALSATCLLITAWL